MEQFYLSIPEIKSKISDQYILIEVYIEQRNKFQDLLAKGSPQPQVRAVWKYLLNKALYSLVDAGKELEQLQSRLKLVESLKLGLIN